MSHSVPKPPERGSVRRRSLIRALGVALVAVFVVVELLLFRSYAETERTTRDFSDTTGTTTTLANVQRESLVLARTVSDLSGGDPLGPVELQRGLLQRQTTRFETAAPGHASLIRRSREIQATLKRFDEAFAHAYGSGPRARPGPGSARVQRILGRLELQVKQTFDKEEQALYKALTETLHKRAESQKLLVGLGGFGLLLAVLLALVIRRSIRRDFARAYEALATEVRERTALQEELSHRVLHDPLTELGNRAYFHDQLERAASSPDPFAVLYLDLDGFKAANDLLGHDAGDELLCEVARRLVEHVRPDDRVARLGGDEFAILLRGLRDRAAAAQVAERLLEGLGRQAHVAGQVIQIGASLGVALGEPDADPDELIGNADLAMYAAKQEGKGGARFYTPAMRAEPEARRRLEGELRTAIDAGELELHFQPVVDLGSERVAGLEALVRWRHPHRGLLLPAEFLPVAEDTGLIVPLGRWVLEEACRSARAWEGLDPAGPAPWIAVNVAPAQVGEPGFLDEVGAALRHGALDPQLLVLEISEHAVFESGRPTNAFAAQVRELGVRIALDDFGTGKSTLGSLRFLPIDILKIDRSFVDRVTFEEEDGHRLTAAVIKLGENLGLTTVAEGIERPEQVAALRGMGCPMGQGFHFSRPLPLERVCELLERHAASSSPRRESA